MQLSSPTDLFKYCPGGSIITITFVAKVSEDRSDKDILVQPFHIVQQIQENLPEYHTRAQKCHFKNKL